MQDENSSNQQQNPPPNTNPKQPHEETSSNGNNGGGGQPPNDIPQEEPLEPFRNDRNENERTANIVATQANEIAREANRIAEKSNSISWFSFIGSAIIVVFTGFLLYKTIESTKAATDSATAAQNTYHQQRRTDSVMLYRDSVKSRNDSISQSDKDKRDAEQFAINISNERKRFKVDSMSVAAQIQSLKEAQKQFIAANEPFLQIDSFKVKYPLEIDKPIRITLKFRNLKASPVQITVVENFGLITYRKRIGFNEFRKKFKKSEINSYITPDMPFPTVTEIKATLKETDDFIKGYKPIVVFSDVTYQDLVTKRYRFYRSTIQVFVNKVVTKDAAGGVKTDIYTSYRFMYNENGYINQKN